MIKKELDAERVEQAKYYFGAHYGPKGWGELEKWLFEEGLIPSKTITKEELTLLAWLTRLRQEPYRQTRGKYRVGPYFCALGMLAEVACAADAISEDGEAAVPSEIGALAGLDAQQADAIIAMNEGDGVRPYSFPEIADIVASWFAEPAQPKEVQLSMCWDVTVDNRENSPFLVATPNGKVHAS